jgi:hypothetical protein
VTMSAGMALLMLLAQASEDPAALVDSVVKAAGGKEKLLTTFRIKERLALGSDLEAKGSERISVLQAPGHWYVGKRNRVTEENEPAVKLAWAWTLKALLDPGSKLDVLPPAGPLVGIRIRGSIDPPMDVWFDSKERRLSAIDWRKDRHVFSEWKELDGLHYPSRVVGHKPDGKVWYHTRIVELTRLEDLPPELKR